MLSCLPGNRAKSVHPERNDGQELGLSLQHVLQPEERYLEAAAPQDAKTNILGSGREQTAGFAAQRARMDHTINMLPGKWMVARAA